MGPERGFGPFGGPGGYASGGDSAVAILSTVLRFVVWVLVILAIVWIVREVLRHTGRPRRQQPPRRARRSPSSSCATPEAR